MDIYFVQQIDNSHLVRVADPRRRREQWMLVCGAALVFLLLLGYALQRFEMVRLGYRLETARKQVAQLEQWNRGLRLEEASLRNPDRIYTLASQRLGMSTAEPGQVLALDDAPAAEAPVVAEVQRTSSISNPR